MEQNFKILLICILCFGALVSSVANAQPMGPAKDIKPTAKEEKTEVSIEELDLPYKPKDIEEGVSIEESLENFEDLHPGLDPTKPVKKEFDWTQIPFVPSKTPTFKPLSDPEL